MSDKASKSVWIMSLIFLLGFLSWLGVRLFSGPNLKPAWAGDSPATGGTLISGYTWTDTIGWIRLGPYKNGSLSYGVAVDDSGNFLANSFAWAENVGWVAFASYDGAPIPPNYVCGSGAWACFDTNTRKIKGWALVVSMGDKNGWISLDGNNWSGGSDYGVSVKDSSDKNTWGLFSGYAWGGETDASRGANYGPTEGLGWLSVNCSNQNTCGTANYYLSGRPGQIVLQGIHPTEGSNNSSLSLFWNKNNFNTRYYQIFRKVKKCSNKAIACSEDAQCGGGTCSYGETETLDSDYGHGQNKDSYTDGNPKLDPYAAYQYQVKACNIFACTESTWKEGVTSPFDDILNFKTNPICKTPEASTSYVDLSWSRPYIASSLVDLARYELEYCILSAGGKLSDCDGKWLNDTKGTCTNDANGLGKLIASTVKTPVCRDVITGDRYNKRSQLWVYRIRAVGNDGASRKYCDGGNNSGNTCTSNTDCQTTGVCTDGWCEANSAKSCSANSDCNTSGTCAEHPSKSGWSYSRLFRVCVSGGNYEETRPE